ncbi:MAG: DUF937 domain-containing protein [Steroidobacteraceae bacterium]
MAASLLDGLIGLITPDVVGKASSMLGEPESAMRKGIGGTLPTVLSGIAGRADDSSFTSSLFEMVRSPANDGSILNDVGGLLGASSTSPAMGLGGKLLGSLFGGGTSTFTNALAGYAGVKTSTATTLLNFVAPLVLAFLGKRVRNDGLNASSLAKLLRGQKDSIAAAVPEPLRDTGFYPAAPVRGREAYRRPVVERRSSTWRWALPALVAVVAIALLFTMFGGDDRDAERAPTVATATATVYFDVGQAAPPLDAVASLSSVVEYLKANPGATAVVSGYQDPSGDPAANEELAKNRVESVRSTLVSEGIDESRIEMQKPVVAEVGGTSDEARRVEVTASS